MGIDAATMKVITEIDHLMAMEAIARGRAALAEPLPAPRCERLHAAYLRRWRDSIFLVEHNARGGRWS